MKNKFIMLSTIVMMFLLNIISYGNTFDTAVEISDSPIIIENYSVEEPSIYFDPVIQISVDNKIVYSDNCNIIMTLYALSNVNIRTEPSTFDNNIYKELQFGESVDIVAESGGWYKIKLDNGYYYVCTDFIGTEDELLIRQKWNEFPDATYIWDYFKSLGYNDHVVAGIIGNAMVEVGGWVDNVATMNLDTTNNGRTFYGTWQWNKKLYPDVVGLGIEDQCKFLHNTIPEEFNTFGKKCSGYSHQEFLNIDNASTAALVFAKTYERCGSSSYKRRQRCAELAYNFFTSIS